MSVGLNGNLRDFGISEVFQLIGQQRKTGTLRVREGAREMELHFDEGRIITAAPAGAPGAALGDMLVRTGVLDADVHRRLSRSGEIDTPFEELVVREGHVRATDLREIEDLLTRETLFELLRWVSGSFHFLAQPVRHQRPAEALLPAEQVLMDGLRMVDEWGAFADQAPAPHTVFRRRGSLEEFRSSQSSSTSAHPAATEKIFLLIDGRSPMERVLDLSRLGTFLGTRVVVDLIRSGWIEAVGGPRERVRSSTRLPMRTLLANALPVLLLILLATAVVRPVRAPETLSLQRDPIREAHQRFSAARMRNLVEAYRLVEGQWPTRIQPLQLWAASAGALTPLESGPYYFRQRDQGPMLLAPEP